MAVPMCPHCGYDMMHDHPIILNDFAMLNAASPLRWRGHVIRLTASELSLCWTLMKAFPRPVRRDVILDRMGSDAVGNVIDVYLSRIRKKLRALGAPIPFIAMRGIDHNNRVAWVLVQ